MGALCVGGLVPPVGHLNGEGNSRKQTSFCRMVCLCLCVYFFFPMHPFRNDASGCEGDDDSNKRWKRQFPHVNVCVPRPPLMHALTLSPFYR